MKDVLALLQTGAPLAYFVLTLFALPVLVRGLFALTRSRSQARKEFLELWKDGDKSDDFWLELMIRHCFGEALPASLVRRVIKLPGSPAKLTAIAGSWSWFVYDSESGRLDWKTEWRRVHKRNVIELLLCRVAYAIFGMVGMLAVQTQPPHSGSFIFGVVFLVAAMTCLVHSLNLEIASDELKRVWPLLPSTLHRQKGQCTLAND